MQDYPIQNHQRVILNFIISKFIIPKFAPPSNPDQSHYILVSFHACSCPSMRIRVYPCVSVSSHRGLVSLISLISHSNDLNHPVAGRTTSPLASQRLRNYRSLCAYVDVRKWSVVRCTAPSFVLGRETSLSQMRLAKVPDETGPVLRRPVTQHNVCERRTLPLPSRPVRRVRCLLQVHGWLVLHVSKW